MHTKKKKKKRRQRKIKMEYRSIYQFINQYNIKYTQNYMIHKRKVMERGGGREEGGMKGGMMKFEN